MIKEIEAWVKKINEQDFPIFKSTVKTISQLTMEDEASASELAGAILRDPSLTAKILKFSNSSYYNPSQAPTNTISRAVVLMGFDVVRELSLSLAIIESLLKGKRRQVVTELMAKAFHAATQARSLAEQQSLPGLEEIFIATLMHDIGEMAFWCMADEVTAKRLFTELNEHKLSPEKAQKKVLGFNFPQLTHELIKAWNFNSDLTAALDNQQSGNKRVQAVLLGREIAAAVNSGLESDSAKEIYKKLAARLNQPLIKCKKMIKEAARSAAEVARNYGATSVAELIPGFEELSAPELETATSKECTFPEPDPILQLKVLRDLSSLIKANPDLNMVIEILLEGIHRGVGMDRALFALYMPLKSQVRAKYVVGIKAEGLMNSFAVNVGDATNNPFSEVLFEKGSGLWITPTLGQQYAKTTMSKIQDMVGTQHFFISPVIVNRRPIGLFYADQHPSRRPLDQASFESFEHFAHQASFTIELISNRLAGQE